MGRRAQLVGGRSPARRWHRVRLGRGTRRARHRNQRPLAAAVPTVPPQGRLSGHIDDSARRRRLPAESPLQRELPARPPGVRRHPPFCAAVRKPSAGPTVRGVLSRIPHLDRLFLDGLLFHATRHPSAARSGLPGGRPDAWDRLLHRPAGARSALSLARSRERGPGLVPAAGPVDPLDTIACGLPGAIGIQPSRRPTTGYERAAEAGT
jgi:hypothetical protein